MGPRTLEKLGPIDNIVAARLCQGCGACAYACQTSAIELHNFVEIGIRPTVDSSKCTECGDCVSVCSGIDLQHEEAAGQTAPIVELRKEWGPVLELWEGHATDEDIWFKGGSGGVATALAVFAIEQLDYSGALHVGMNPKAPYLNQVALSTQREQLIQNTGSRYAPAAVCGSLAEIENADHPCVLIGKPCDIAAARKAARLRPRLADKLGFTIGIFCGGTPSTRGTFEVLKSLGVTKEEIDSLRYRGHGWPGMTGVNLKASSDGKRVEMTYARAWDSILTKHKPWRCQICPDGTGEFADIACGDPWYREIQEGERGSTLIVVRSERGRSVLNAAMKAGYVSATRCSADILPRSQQGLLHRRRAVLPKLLGLWLTRSLTPSFRGFYLWHGWQQHSLRRRASSLYRGLRWTLGLKRKGLLSTKGEPTLNVGGGESPTHKD